MNSTTQSNWISKKLAIVVKFAIPVVADVLLPGSGLAIEVCFLIWELLQDEAESSTRTPSLGDLTDCAPAVEFDAKPDSIATAGQSLKDE